MLYLSLLLTSLDQLAKYLIPTLNPPLWLIDGQVGIILSHNSGSAFSIPIPGTFTIPIGVIAITSLLYAHQYNILSHNRLSNLTIALLISGALGNLIDRILLGHVVDFIKIFSWPSFNLADTFLTIGAILLIIFFDKIKIKGN